MKNLLKNNLVKLTAILITWSLLCVGISQAYTVMGRDEGGTGINPEDFLVGDMIFISQDDAYAFQRLSAQGQNETVLQTVAGIPTWQYLSRIRALKEFGDTNATTTALGPFEANMLAIFNDDVAMYNLLTVNRFLATSTTATSTVDGYFDIGKGLEVGANKGFWVHESAPVNSLIVMDSGFVGVATNTPYRALSVLGDGAISGNLNIAALTATSSLTVSSATATSTLPQLDVTDIDGTRADFDFLTINTSATIPTLTVTYASTTALTVDEGAWLAVNSGNVGVGTTSPWKKFSVLGDGIFTSDLSVANLTATGTASVTGTLTVDSTSTSTIPELLTTSLVAGGYLEIPYFNATGTATSTILALEGTDIGATRMDTDFLTVNTSGVIPTLTGTSLTYTNASTTYTSATNYSASGYFESESTTATNTMPQLDVTDIDGTRGDFDYLTINTSATIPSLTITNATSTYATTTDLYVSNWMNIASGKDYLINGTSVLNATTLGGAVVNSSLTSLGTITNLIATYASTTGLDLAGYLVTPLATSTSATTTDLYVSNWLNLASGKDYLINGTSVLNATTLGGAVVNSSLTSLGTIANLTATYASTTNLTSDKDAWFAVTSGNVGIGTTSPLSMLSVRSSGTTDLLNLVETGGVEVFTVLENGNVGIGTTAPVNTGTGDTLVLDITSSIPSIAIHGTNGASTQEFSIASDGAGAYIDISGSGTATNNNLIFRTEETNSQFTATERMRITSAGNVGIGTTSPGALLSVHGDSYLSGSLYVGGAITATSTLDVTGLATMVSASTTYLSATNLDLSGVVTVNSTSATSTFANGIQFTGGGLTLDNFTTCNLDTDASGNLVCGTDEGAFPFTVTADGNSTTTALYLDGGLSALASSTIKNLIVDKLTATTTLDYWFNNTSGIAGLGVYQIQGTLNATTSTIDNLVINTTVDIPAGEVDAGDYAAASIDGDDVNSNIAGRSLTLTAASPDTLDVDAELYTSMASFNIASSTLGTTTSVAQHKFATAITITRITCSTDVGTTTIGFDLRAEGTPNTVGSDIMYSTGLVCGSGVGAIATTTIGDPTIAADALVNLEVIDSEPTGSKPTIVRIHVDYTKDD